MPKPIDELTREEVAVFAGEKPPVDPEQFDRRKIASFGMSDIALSLLLQSLHAKIQPGSPQFTIGPKDWSGSKTAGDFVKKVERNAAGTA